MILESVVERPFKNKRYYAIFSTILRLFDLILIYHNNIASPFSSEKGSVIVWQDSPLSISPIISHHYFKPSTMKNRILSLLVPTLLNFPFALQAQIVSPYTITQYQEEACLSNQQNEEECSIIDLSLPIYKDQPWLNTYIVHNLVGNSQFQIDKPIEIQIKQFLSRAIADMIEYDAEYDSIETQFLGQTILPKGHFQHFFALLNSNETYFKGAAHGNSEQTLYLLDTKTQKIVHSKPCL